MTNASQKLEAAKLNIHAINNARRLQVRAEGGVKLTTWEYEAWLDEVSAPKAGRPAPADDFDFEFNPVA